MPEVKTLISVEQFAAMPFPDERVELSEGELIRMPPAVFEHGRVAGNAARILGNFVDKNQLGAVLTAEPGFVLGSHTLRAPDVGFVSKERLAAVGHTIGFWPTAPDLAVEVVSPSDSASDLQKKVREYFQGGGRMVLVLYPQLQQVHVYRGPKEVRVLEGHETLSGEDLLPGFSVQVEEFFR